MMDFRNLSQYAKYTKGFVPSVTHTNRSAALKLRGPGQRTKLEEPEIVEQQRQYLGQPRVERLIR